MNLPPIVSPREWKAAREELLVEKEDHAHPRRACAKAGRMPRMAVEKEYVRGPGRAGRPGRPVRGAPPLILYRFFFELACPAGLRRLPGLLLGRRPDHPPGPSERPRHHDRARLARPAGRHRALEGMDGLEVIPWYTITDDFDADFDVDEWHGTNVFLRDDDDQVFRTYFVDGRGDEALAGSGPTSTSPARTPGGMGGLAGRLSADPGRHLDQAPRRVRVGRGGGGHREDFDEMARATAPRTPRRGPERS